MTHSPPTVARRLLVLALLAALAQPGCGQAGSNMNPDLFASPREAELFAAAARDDLPRARQLLAEGASFTAINAKEKSVLDVALLTGQWRAFKNLLDLGADPASMGSRRTTTMHLAAIQQDSRWLEEILRRGASTEARNSLGETPLFPALGKSTKANFKLLLDAGADIHARNKDGETLLHIAAAINSFDQVLTLLELGVDPRLTDRRGKTFQSGFFMTPEDMLAPDVKATRAKVRAWLRERGIAVEG